MKAQIVPIHHLQLYKPLYEKYLIWELQTLQEKKMFISKSCAYFVLTVLVTSHVYAGNPVFPGPYSAWSQSQKSQIAQILENGSNHECGGYIQKARSGDIRATYEATACTIAYFVNHLPDDYPYIDNYRAAAHRGYNRAKQLGSDIPVFLNE